MNVKEFLTKLDAIDKVMELMKKENAENEKTRIYQTKNVNTNTTANDRLKAAEKFVEQKRHFSTFNQRRKGSQVVPQPNIVFNESTKNMIEKHNDNLLFNRRRSKLTLPALSSKKLSSSSSSSSSDSLDSSLSDNELKPFAVKRSLNSQTQPAKGTK
jgi:hypothetical protein